MFEFITQKSPQTFHLWGICSFIISRNNFFFNHNLSLLKSLILPRIFQLLYVKFRPVLYLEAEKLWGTVDLATGLMPRVSMTAEESAVFSSRFSDISTYLQQIVPQFIIGTEPLENWDVYVENIEAMGLAECLSVEQAALDRYNAR